MRKLIFIILSVLIFTLFFYYGSSVSFREQWPLYESLRNTSAIIFGVMGAWIAIIYPGALGRILSSRDVKANDSEYRKIRKLISPMVYSTLIISFVLLVGVLAPLFKQVDFFMSHYVLMRRLTFGLLGMLTFSQLCALILTLVPANMAQTEAQDEKSKREALNRKFPPQN